METPPVVREGSGMPRDIHHAYTFEIFNTLSFTLAIGLPKLLFLKHLGASGTILGIAVSLPSLLSILQIPAAHLVERTGYRTFMLRGWAMRSFFILGMIAVPPLGLFLDPTTSIALMLFFLFGYNTSRGISVCAYLPWITHLVPEHLRGVFGSRQQVCSMLAACITMLGTAALFRGSGTTWSFTAAFSISFVSAMISLYFLRSIPDVPVQAEEKSGEKFSWKDPLRHRPFLKLLAYNVVVNAALAANGVFWMPALRDLYHWTDSQILLLSASGFAIAMLATWIFGRVLDRVGSRPILAFSGILLLVHFSVWCGITARWIHIHLWSLVLLQLSSCGVSIFNLANTRLAMGTVPTYRRSQFFAFYSVVVNLTLGLLPIAWGIVLDALRGFHWNIENGDFNRYSLLYVTLVTLVGISFFNLRSLDETKAMTTEAFFYELLVATPARAMTRLLPGGRRFFS